MPLYCWPPAAVDGEHAVSTADIVREFRTTHPDVPFADRIDGIAASTQIATRRWFLPLSAVTEPGHHGLDLVAADDARRALTGAGLDQVTADSVLAALRTMPSRQTIAERTAPAWAAVCDYATRATLLSLDQAGLSPTDVDVLITSNSTTPALPGLDVELLHRTGMRPDVITYPFTGWACGASTRALALAAQIVDADPNLIVQITVSEALSTTYQVADGSLDALIGRMLFCDSAGAITVTGRPRDGVWLRLDAAYHATLPGTAGHHRLETRADGVHFLMDREGPRAVQASLPLVWQWLTGRHGPGWSPDILFAHPGSTRILEYMAQTLPSGWTPDLLAPTWEAYATGNRGGVSVLDLMARTCRTTPKSGARVAVYAASPGLHITAHDGETL
ncbi:polyketide synthase [Streptomyces viridochromogenes]|uniref:Polyketide synthase n=1 Tax=Streptomyces viridochromogenes TaxID=1938 RepID=A0A0J8C8F9_STRVR|nr:polyketide synthase [Streptomyces viridochromogenes]KMS74175.1 polyketide synthase [Streptomyces viridochromogenes]